MLFCFSLSLLLSLSYRVAAQQQLLSILSKEEMESADWHRLDLAIEEQFDLIKKLKTFVGKLNHIQFTCESTCAIISNFSFAQTNFLNPRNNC